MSSIRRPCPASPASSAASASGCVGPGVDERERVAPEEPAVDGTDGERRREDDRLHRQPGGATMIAGSAANAKNGAARASSSARARSSSQRLDTRRPAAGPGRAIDLEHIRLGARNRIGAEREHAISARSRPGLRAPRRTAPSTRMPGRGSAPRPASRSRGSSRTPNDSRSASRSANHVSEQIVRSPSLGHSSSSGRFWTYPSSNGVGA